jgi:protein TonB
MGVHAALLSLRLAAPAQFDRLFKDTPLDVILVNTRIVAEAPQKAQALAQTQLAGGGEQRTGRAASPLPSAATTTAGESADTLHKQMASLQQQQALLLAQVKDLLAQLPPTQTKKADAKQDAHEEKRRQLLKLLAEIEQRIDQDNARPRKHYISPATREVAYAQYYDALRRKIEERGTLYFPERGGQKLYGELTMVITVNTDGRVLNTEVVQLAISPWPCANKLTNWPSFRVLFSAATTPCKLQVVRERTDETLSHDPCVALAAVGAGGLVGFTNFFLRTHRRDGTHRP